MLIYLAIYLSTCLSMYVCIVFLFPLESKVYFLAGWHDGSWIPQLQLQLELNLISSEMNL